MPSDPSRSYADGGSSPITSLQNGSSMVSSASSVAMPVHRVPRSAIAWPYMWCHLAPIIDHAKSTWLNTPLRRRECVQLLKELGRVECIVLTTHAYEHKLFVAPFSRKFPDAKVCVRVAESACRGCARAMM